MMRIRQTLIRYLMAGLLIPGLMLGQAQADRLKDLATLQGVRSNPLVGYGLVVGLNGTGDQTTQTPFTVQSFRNMLNQFGVNIPPGTNFQLKNVAAVSIHAELPAFAKPGQNIDITVSSIGNAGSLRGGTLLMAPLRGIDGQVYAIAQGNLVVGGFGAEGADGSSITVNVPSVGRIPNGATVEREVTTSFAFNDNIIFNLHRADFTTAKHVADAINRMLGGAVASAMDASSIKVSAPLDPSARVDFMSLLENMQVDPGDAMARVVINSRTGTIVIGDHVQVRAAAVTHGSLTVVISEDPEIVQPNPLAEGETAVEPNTAIAINQEEQPMFLFGAGVTLSEIVRMVNEVGAAPGDLMAILEALKQAGALQADLVVI